MDTDSVCDDNKIGIMRGWNVTENSDNDILKNVGHYIILCLTVEKVRA